MNFSAMKTAQMLTTNNSFNKNLKIFDTTRKKRLGKMTSRMF